MLRQQASLVEGVSTRWSAVWTSPRGSMLQHAKTEIGVPLPTLRLMERPWLARHTYPVPWTRCVALAVL